MMTISKRAIIRAVCFLVAGILVCTGALVQSYRAEEQFRTQVEYEYQYALSDLSDSLSSLSVTLEKSRYASTPAQISMAWMLCKKPWIVPIPGTRKPERMKENMGAAAIPLTESEINALDEALNHMQMSAVYGVMPAKMNHTVAK